MSGCVANKGFVSAILAERHNNCVSKASTRVFINGSKTHDIFEGTEQIQQLVISRAISGMRIQ